MLEFVLDLTVWATPQSNGAWYSVCEVAGCDTADETQIRSTAQRRSHRHLGIIIFLLFSVREGCVNELPADASSVVGNEVADVVTLRFKRFRHVLQIVGLDHPNLVHQAKLLRMLFARLFCVA